LIIVDYIGLAEANGENRVQEVAVISRNLKAMARELDVPVLALSQLSRAGDNQMPELRHLRDSGAVEQDADVVLMLHRPEAYDKTTDLKGIAEIGIAKQRNGELGTVATRFNPYTTQFCNLDRYRTVEGY
jgi:replicative DNA helicase